MRHGDDETRGRREKTIIFAKSMVSFAASLRRRVYASLFLLGALFCGHFSASAQRTGLGWVWQNPLPQGNPLYSIHFAPDKETGYAAGSNNTILSSTHGRFSWRRHTAPIHLTYSRVFLVDVA